MDKSHKYIILVRHGEPDNKNKIVYNLDEVMKKEDIMHITENGKNQLKALGKAIKRLGFNIVRFSYSNQTRAVESARALNNILEISNFNKEERLKDTFAPGPYLENLLMDEVWKKSANVYDKNRWGKYGHESPEEVLNRFSRVFAETIELLEPGEAAILLSHGDPIAWFVQYKTVGKLPDPLELKSRMYPVQGQGIVMELNSENELVKHYLLKDPALVAGKIY